VPARAGKTDSFSPHLTLGGVGCALSHRRAWERIAGQKANKWGLVLEDDVSAIAVNFADQLRKIVRRRAVPAAPAAYTLLPAACCLLHLAYCLLQAASHVGALLPGVPRVKRHAHPPGRRALAV
jgi:hypothetical protein